MAYSNSFKKLSCDYFIYFQYALGIIHPGFSIRPLEIDEDIQNVMKIDQDIR